MTISNTRRSLPLLLLVAGATASGAVLAEGSRATREAMADAMVRMMDVMGFLGDDGDRQQRRSSRRSNSGRDFFSSPGRWSRFSGMDTFGFPGLSPWATGFPGMGSPWSGFGWPGGSMGNPMSFAPPWGSDLPWGGGYGYGSGPMGPLEGSWESPSGELLLIEGGRYRMYSGESRYLDGLIDLDGDRILLHNPQQDYTREFEFAYKDGRLILRDETGQIYLYRRIFQNDSPQDPWR